MSTIKDTLIAAALLCMGTFARGQEVGDKAYGLMLSALLSRDVPEVDVSTAATMEDAVFLDTRARAEFEVSHIPGARWGGFDTFEIDRMEGVTLDRPVVVYCSVGYRSEKITRLLKEHGYTHVYNLYGGIFEWVNRGMPVANADGITEKVHAYNVFWGQWLRRGQKVY